MCSRLSDQVSRLIEVIEGRVTKSGNLSYKQSSASLEKRSEQSYEVKIANKKRLDDVERKGSVYNDGWPCVSEEVTILKNRLEDPIRKLEIPRVTCTGTSPLNNSYTTEFFNSISLPGVRYIFGENEPKLHKLLWTLFTWQSFLSALLIFRMRTSVGKIPW